MIYLKGLLILIEIVSSILLIVIVLLQRSKSEGLGLAFGSQMGESLFGARAGNVLVKATVWLGVIFLVNTTVLAKIYSKGISQSLISASSPASMPLKAPGPGPMGQPANQPAASAEPVSAQTPPLAATPFPAVPVSAPAATPAPAPAP